jgi:hypothetical protein
VGANLSSVDATLRRLERSGGRGWWSDALVSVAHDVEANGGSVVVSLDWGFQEPLLFLTDRTRAIEAVWPIHDSLRARRPWSLRGDVRHVYLVHEPPLDHFGLGQGFLAAVARLKPGLATTRRYLDREGGVAFLAVRFSEPHRLVYDGAWRVQIAPAPRAPAGDAPSGHAAPRRTD